MKVLILSHLPMATQSNMGKTFLSLFSAFDREELCQIYIYPSYPDVDRCSSFYRVTDKDVLKSLLLGKPGGEVLREKISPTAGLYEHPEDEQFYRSRKNKSAFRRLARDAMWRLSRWNNESLRNWLDKENPECIFVAPGQAMFLYDMALTIAKYRNIPVITYICDEYYFVNEPRQWLDRLRLKLLKAKIRQLVTSSASLAVISQELDQAYRETFGCQSRIFMTGTSYDIADSPRVSDSPDRISYFGNIRCNRYLSLAQVGRELDRINRELGTDYCLEIYTSEKDPEILSHFSGIASVEVKGFLTGEAFLEAFRSARLLLHTEAFDELSVDFVKHSVSTKIADSLASGIPLLAYGPADISSMQHLIRNNCALTATAPEDLQAVLLQAFRDREAARQAAARGLAAAKEYHDSQATSRRLKEMMKQVIRQGR